MKNFYVSKWKNMLSKHFASEKKHVLEALFIFTRMKEGSSKRFLCLQMKKKNKWFLKCFACLQTRSASVFHLKKSKDVLEAIFYVCKLMKNHVFEAFCIFTKWKNTFWKLCSSLQNEKHDFKAFLNVCKPTFSKRFLIMFANAKNTFTKNFASLQNERGYFKPYNTGGTFSKFHLFTKTTGCEVMYCISLDSWTLQDSQNIFFFVIRPFFTSPDSFEVGKSVKYRRNFDLNLSFIHVTFWEKWKNMFLPS